uniref:Uncharacterized protein n=1 Tax=Glossina palpalis gambiensis TaxID=67801 RepID=A0A1B0B5T1_9MUSC
MKTKLTFEDAVHITAILGEGVIFNCHVEFPNDHPVPYVLQWDKKFDSFNRTFAFSEVSMVAPFLLILNFYTQLVYALQTPANYKSAYLACEFCLLMLDTEG